MTFKGAIEQLIPGYLSIKSDSKKAKLLKQHRKALFARVESEPDANIRIALKVEFQTYTGQSLWVREESFFPAIEPKDIREVLQSLKADEKLHYDEENNVFRKRKIRKNVDKLKVGEKSKAAFYAILKEIEKSLETDEPNAELYFALINSPWFKLYAKGDLEQASIVALSASLLKSLIVLVRRAYINLRNYSNLRKLIGLSTLDLQLLEQRVSAGISCTPIPYALIFLEHSEEIRNAFLSQELANKTALEQLFKEALSDEKTKQLVGAYLSSYNSEIFLSAVNPTIANSRGGAGYSLLNDKKISKLDFGSKVIVWNRVRCGFALVESSEANLVEKNAAFHLLINQIPTPDSEGDNCESLLEAIRGDIIENKAYLLNGEHLIDYLKSLTANLKAAKKSKSNEGFLEIQLMVDSLERFLLIIPFNYMTHQDGVIKALRGFYENYEDALYQYYLADFNKEQVIEELNTKKTQNEQWLVKERLARFYARAQGKEQGEFLHEGIESVRNTTLSEKPFLPKSQDAVSVFECLGKETFFQRLRRKHYGKIGYFVGLPLGVGAAALLTFAVMAVFNPVLGIILGIAALAINCLVYPKVVSSLTKEGIRTVGEHTIKQRKYQVALGLSFFTTSTLSLLLGIATAFAIIGLSAATFGIVPALVLGVGIGLVTWVGNTFLNTDIFRTLFAYLDRWGVKEGWKRMTARVGAFFSFKECRDWQDVVKKCVHIALQPLFILGGIVLAVISSVAMIGVLRGSFLELMGTYLNATAYVSQLLANILVRGVGLFAELPLELSSAARVLNNWGKHLAHVVSAFLVKTVLFFTQPLSKTWDATKTSTIKIYNKLTNFFSKEMKEFHDNPKIYLKKCALKLLSFFWIGFKQVSLPLNATANLLLAESGAEENQELTGHVSDTFVGEATAVSGGVLSYMVCQAYANEGLDFTKEKETLDKTVVTIGAKGRFFTENHVVTVDEDNENNWRPKN